MVTGSSRDTNSGSSSSMMSSISNPSMMVFGVSTSSWNISRYTKSKGWNVILRPRLQSAWWQDSSHRVLRGRPLWGCEPPRPSFFSSWHRLSPGLTWGSWLRREGISPPHCESGLRGTQSCRFLWYPCRWDNVSENIKIELGRNG